MTTKALPPDMPRCSPGGHPKLTPVEEERIRANAGHIPVPELALLMGRHPDTIRLWAKRHKVCTRTGKPGPKPGRRPAVVSPRKECSRVERMMDLVERICA